MEWSRREENRSSNSLLAIFLREHLYITYRPTVFQNKVDGDLYLLIFIVCMTVLWSLCIHDILKPDSYVFYDIFCFGLLPPPQDMKGCSSPCWLSTTHIWVLQCIKVDHNYSCGSVTTKLMWLIAKLFVDIAHILWVFQNLAHGLTSHKFSLWATLFEKASQFWSARPSTGHGTTFAFRKHVIWWFKKSGMRATRHCYKIV